MVDFLINFPMTSRINNFKWLLEKLKNWKKKLIVKTSCTGVQKLLQQPVKVLENGSKLVKNRSIGRTFIF